MKTTYVMREDIKNSKKKKVKLRDHEKMMNI